MGTSYDIISELENGAKLFTSKKEMEESKNNLDENNTKWIKVRLTSGEVGYVCASFVEEYEKNKNMMIQYIQLILEMKDKKKDIWDLMFLFQQIMCFLKNYCVKEMIIMIKKEEQ